MPRDEYAYPGDLDSDVDSVDWDDREDDIDGSDVSAYMPMEGAARYTSNSTSIFGRHLCVVCRSNPAYNKNGRSYPTCGLTCAAHLEARAGPLPIQSNDRWIGAAGSVPSWRDASGRYLGGGQHAQGRHNSHGANYIPLRDPYRATLNGYSSYPSQRRTPHFIPPPPKCVVCKQKSAYPGKPTCGMKCADKLARDGGDSTLCEYCHERPRNKNYPHCGKTCADKAKFACLFCKSRPKNGRYHLCSNTCKKLATKSTPLLLEAPKGHVTFDMVEKKFKAGWKSPNACPEIKKVFKIIEDDDFLKPYNTYRRQKGNEHFRYHGTKRSCQLGQDGSNQTKVCGSTSCAICSILATSFKVSLAKNGCFGPGVYSSTWSSTSFGYCGTGGSMLLTKVVLGKPKNVTQGGEVKSCPPGYDSVVYDTQMGATSHNETIVYSDDAIRPVFLITF